MGKFNLTSLTSRNNQMTEIPGEALIYNNEYERYEGENFSDMVSSIKQNGILQPLIVRPTDDGKYIILSGNNRKFCGEAAGLKVFPCIIKEGLSDEEAQVYIDETNIYQRGFGNLKISKQAEVVARRHNQMFDEDKLKAIQVEIARMNGDKVDLDDAAQEKTSKLQKVGNEYGLSKNSIARLIRIDKLVAELKPFVDNSLIAMRTAVDLSYLPESNQQKVAELAEQGYIVDMKQAALMRQLYTQNGLTDKVVEEVVKGLYKPPKSKPARSRAITIKATVIKKYFPPETEQKTIEETVDKALQLYFASGRKS